MGSAQIFFACSIVISLMTSVAGYVEKCYACGISGADKDMETCFTTPSSSRIQNCSEILPIEWRDKWICLSTYYTLNGIGFAQRNCVISSPKCNTVETHEGTTFTFKCCGTDLCNGASKTTQHLSLVFILLILLASLNNVLARV